MQINPEIKSLEPMSVVYVSYKGNYMGNQQIFSDLIGKLCAWAGPKGLLGPNMEMRAVYQDDPKTTPPEELTVDIALTAPEDIEVDGEVKKKELAGGKYAVASVELAGAQEYGPAWESISKWILENGFEYDMSRPSYEIYKNDPNTHPEGHHILDICAAVR